MNLRHSVPLLTAYREDTSPDKLRSGKNENTETRIASPDMIQEKALLDQAKTLKHTESTERLQEENQRMTKELNQKEEEFKYQNQQLADDNKRLILVHQEHSI